MPWLHLHGKINALFHFPTREAPLLDTPIEDTLNAL
jgi:hypothetical protein